MKNQLTLLLCLFATSAFSQPVIEWQQSFGGIDYDYGHDIQLTADGGYIAAGTTTSANSGNVGNLQGSSDCWVVKMDATGAIQWQRALGGSNSETAFSIHQTTDGGYILGAHTESDDGDVSGHHGNRDFWVVKLNALGDIEWQRALGGTGNENMGSVKQTTDGGYFVCGIAGSSNGDVVGNHGVGDIWVLKLDPTGAIQWQRALGGSASDYTNGAIQAADGGFVIAGSTRSIDGDLSFTRGAEDAWIIKLTATGAIEWSNTFGGNQSDFVLSIHQTSDGGYVTAGHTNSNNGDVSGNHGSSDFWVLKLDATGTLEWQRALGGTSSELATDVRQTEDGGYIVGGHTYSNDGQVTGYQGNTDCWIVKLDASGDLVWQKTLGGSGDDQMFGIEQTAEGGFVLISGSNSSDGDVTGHLGDADFWVVKLSSGITGVEDTPVRESSALSIFPNPTSGLIRITLDREAIPVQAVLTDMSGKLLYAKTIDDAGYLDVSGLPSGVYTLTVTDQNGIRYSGKVVR